MLSNRKKSAFLLLESCLNLSIMLVLSLLLSGLVLTNEYQMQQNRQTFQELVAENKQLKLELADGQRVP